MKINLIANLNGALMGLSFDAEHEITLGREIGNTISPLTADGLSRHHAKLYFKDGTWYVEDLGSTNGTYLMGAKIEGPKPLAAKNVLQFGNFKLTIDELGESAAPAAFAPAPIAAPPPVVEPVAAAVPPPPPPPPPPPAPAPQPAEKPLMTPSEAALAGAAAEMSENAAGAGTVRRPTVPIKPGARPLPAGLKKPTLPMPPTLPPKPEPAPAPLPAVEELKPLEPLEPLTPLEPLEPLEPVAELTPVEPLEPVSPLAPVKPAAPAKPALRPGIKLPTQPGLKPGVRLPTQPGLKPGIKLPTKPSFKPGVRLPTKPGIKLPPKG